MDLDRHLLHQQGRRPGNERIYQSHVPVVPASRGVLRLPGRLPMRRSSGAKWPTLVPWQVPGQRVVLKGVDSTRTATAGELSFCMVQKRPFSVIKPPDFRRL